MADTNWLSVEVIMSYTLSKSRSRLGRSQGCAYYGKCLSQNENDKSESVLVSDFKVEIVTTYQRKNNSKRAHGGIRKL